MQNKCICNESESACSDKQAGDKEGITDTGRTMNCRISAYTTRVVVRVVTSRRAEGSRQRQTAADSRQQVVGKQ